MDIAERVVQRMLAADKMSQWLGLEIEALRPGHCRLQFVVRDEMLNGFGIVHGGVVFSAADSAFAFACNTHGRLSLALDAHINFVASSGIGETLVVEANEVHLGRKTGVYRVEVTKADGDLVATFTGTAYRTSRNTLAENEEQA